MTMNPEKREYNQIGLSDHLRSDPRFGFMRAVADTLPDAEWYLVGGAVRDHYLGRTSNKDYDFVVRSAELDDLQESLIEEGKVDLVGRTFGVLKFTPTGFRGEPAIDIAWPRTEYAGGSGGYRDFDVQSDPALPVERDLARRDFTINAMAWDVKKGELVDPFGGAQDLESKTIRAVGEARDRFHEDYSRMLRAIRFSCQLGFEIEKETWEALVSLMPRINDVHKDDEGKEERLVPHEIIAREFLKSFTADPVRCLDLYEHSGALEAVLPELGHLRGCEQSPDHHSEGDVWEHTKLALKKLVGPDFSSVFPGEECSKETMVALMLHDIGKPDTKAQGEERITFYGHEERGAKMARAIEDRLRFSSVEGSGVNKENLAWLVKHHLFPNVVDVDNVRRTTLTRYFLKDRRLGRSLLHLAWADGSASIPEGAEPDLSNLRQVMKALKDIEDRAQVGWLLSGDDIMEETGLRSGPEVGRIIEMLKEKQLRGELETQEEAKDFLRSIHEKA